MIANNASKRDYHQALDDLLCKFIAQGYITHPRNQGVWLTTGLTASLSSPACKAPYGIWVGQSPKGFFSVAAFVEALEDMINQGESVWH